MTDDLKRSKALEAIRASVSKYGQHIYVVSGGNIPRFAYTIGLREILGAELILAGAIIYMYEEVVRIINAVAGNLKDIGALVEDATFTIESLGSFTVSKADSSWTTHLLLGAHDFYQVNEIAGYQIVPDSAHWTIDIPDLSQPWSPVTAPIWKWLREPWSYPVPSKSVAGTNLDALRGDRITEAMRWEEDEWELYAGAGPDVPKDAMRVVPLGTLVAADRSLESVISLRIGEGLWRDAESGWHPWVIKANN